MQSRTGIGYDIHRLIPTVERSAIRLGGVELPCYFKLKAHSDGDVLLHALVDAMLGALALGDIGRWFPDNAPENQGRSSAEFVAEALAQVKKLGWRVAQLDSIVLLEEPKLAPHADNIRRRIATLLGTELTSVSLKAKTMEGLGPIGERKAIAAHVVVTLEFADGTSDNQQPHP
jgi:2-C-methyl-D-erythritol 2,4-cyclodiphosphate synthase